MENFSFPKKNRLLNQAEYRLVFKKKDIFSDRYFTIFSRPNGLDHARLGLAISKKNIRTAAARNRIKRLVRESFRRRCRAVSNLDIVVLAASDAQLATSQILNGSLSSFFEKHAKT